MNISLRRRERLFINGAVIRVDRKVNIELMNDVTFLLEHHVMQPEQATTPLKQLYFAIQTILMTPQDCAAARNFARSLIRDLLQATNQSAIYGALVTIDDQIVRDRSFEALKGVRSLIGEKLASCEAPFPAHAREQVEAGI